jgi:Methyltransferase domain
MGFREAVRIIVQRLLQRLLLGKSSFSRERFTFFEKFGVHVLPVHYYSPVPDTRELRKNLDKWYREWNFTGVDFDMEGQLQILDNLRAYKRECNELLPYNDPFLRELGEGFGELEAHILYAMIRRLKPRNVIEVGSGMSTFFSVNALSRNNEEAEIAATMTCIEPYPRPALHKVNGACQTRIIPKLVQEVSVEFFEALSGGDILFIDSSHMVKINGDVNYLYLEVLPRLAEGVVVHIHDICFPYPTPPPEDWILTKHQFWTEAAMVQAFLIFNSAFKVLLCSSYLHYKAPETLYSVFSFPKYDIGVPSSLWLQKVR